jgi:hypothetical protein
MFFPPHLGHILPSVIFNQNRLQTSVHQRTQSQPSLPLASPDHLICKVLVVEIFCES